MKIDKKDLVELRDKFLVSQEAAVKAQALQAQYNLLVQRVNIKYEVGSGSVDLTTGEVLRGK